MLNIICPANLEATNNQIRALETIMPYDNSRDKEIHEMALERLKAHREMLILK